MRRVCVIGCPRSGTSLTARILQACGLDFGPAQELAKGDSINPEGYLENLPMLVTNDLALAAYGGDFLTPPTLPAGWESGTRIPPELPALADVLIERLPAWKDPRCTFTWDLWASRCELDAVLCVRHPADVCGSLGRIYGLPQPRALELWTQYATTGARRAPRFVVYYEKWFSEPEAQLAGLTSALGLPHNTQALGLIGKCPPISRDQIPEEISARYYALQEIGVAA